MQRSCCEKFNRFTDFVLNHYICWFENRANEGVSTIRSTRLRKFKKSSRKLVFIAKIAAIWYLLILTGSYLTSDTGAYFNDVEKISGTISAAKDFCKELNGKSDYWHNYCKDNAGIGNGPDKPDEDTGEKTDPDNPGHNKGGCDDHTNAPCSEVREVKEKHTSNSINLTWSNPNQGNKNFSHVNVYRNEDKTPVGTNIKNGQFDDEKLKPETKYTYKITTVDKSGKESVGTIIDVTTNADEVVGQNPAQVTKPEDKPEKINNSNSSEDTKTDINNETKDNSISSEETKQEDTADETIQTKKSNEN